MDDQDDALVARLRNIAGEADPVPESVIAAARAAIASRDLDGELAALVADTGAEADVAAFEMVRAGTTAHRLISFGSDGMHIDIEVSGHADGLTLVGQITGSTVVACVLEFADGGGRELSVDDLGRFMTRAVASGPARLRCRAADGGRVTTAWVRL